MTLSSEELLTAIESRALALGQRPAPVLSVDQVAAAEVRLGFPVPTLLRSVYTRLGNGGIGPGRGLMPFLGACPDGLSRNAVEGYLNNVLPMQGHPDMVWPVGMLAFCWWGENVFTYANCSEAGAPVYRFVPPADWSWDVQGYHFRPVGANLAEWLAAWADGQDAEAAEPSTAPDRRGM